MTVKRVSAILAVVLVIFFVTVFASPKRDVKSFWRLCLEGNFEEAEKFTVHESKLEFTKSSGTGTAVNLDGTIIDPTDKERIFRRQIRLERVVEKDSKDYRMGFLVETIDSNSTKRNHIVCLGKVYSSSSWKIFRVFSAGENTISDLCFEK